jgi:pimeloyl-ACP methyl ester carboxylesterase
MVHTRVLVRAAQDAFTKAVQEDRNVINWCQQFAGYQVVDSFLRNGREFGGFILYNNNRNHMIVVIPGTKSSHDWIKNVSFWGKKGNPLTNAGCGLNIHKGFGDAYEQSIESVRSTLLKFLNDNQSTILGSQLTVDVTGHSLGAAVATVLAVDFKDNLLPNRFSELRNADVRLTTVASPRVFDETSAAKAEAILGRSNILRIFNVKDIVPTVPCKWLNSRHVGTEFPIWDDAFAIIGIDPHFMSSYAHLVVSAYSDHTENLQARMAAEAIVGAFPDAYQRVYAKFQFHVNSNDKEVQRAKKIADEAFESDSEGSEALDDIRVQRRADANQEILNAIDAVNAGDLDAATISKGTADEFNKDGLAASALFNHKEAYQRYLQAKRESAMNQLRQDLGMEQSTPNAVDELTPTFVFVPEEVAAH